MNIELAAKFDQRARDLEADAKSQSVRFVAAWKIGVTLSGEYNFLVQSITVVTAIHRNDLRPDIEAIRQALPITNHPQRVFLIGLLQCYDESAIAALCDESDIDQPPLANIALPDHTLRTVLIELLDSFSGW